VRRLISLVACVAVGCSADPGVCVLLEQEADGPVLRVTANYPGANAKTVADTVAAPIEQQVNGVEGMTIIESECRDDGSYVATLRFAPKTDINDAKVLVQNRLAVAEPTLPEEVRRQGVTVHRGDPDQFPLLWVALTNPDKTYDALFLSNYAALRVRDELARVPGVADVRTVGSAGGYAMRIWIDPEKLAARILTTADVIAALQRQNVQVAAGQVGQPPKPADHQPQLTVTTSGKLTDPRQFEDIILKTGEGGKVVYLRDVAKVELGASGGDGFARLNGKPAALLAIRTQGDKPTADGVRKVIARLGETAPKGLTLQVVGDLSADRFAVVELRLPDAASLQRTEEAIARAEKSIRGLPGVAECLSFADRETNTATVLVKLTAKNTATPADIRKSLADIRDAAVRVSDVSGGRPFPVRIALTDEGDHGIEKLTEWAEAVAKKLAADGVAVDLAVEPAAVAPRLYLDIDREKAEKMGVKLDDIFSTLEASLGSVYVNDFNKFGRSYQVRVQAGEKAIKPEDAKKLKVRGREGEMVPLGTILTVRETSAPPATLRVNLYPALRITAAAPEGKTVAEVTAKCVAVAEAERKALKMPDAFKVVNLVEVKPR
jgi:multidrug efflux pump subunit AcrB